MAAQAPGRLVEVPDVALAYERWAYGEGWTAGRVDGRRDGFAEGYAAGFGARTTYGPPAGRPEYRGGPVAWTAAEDCTHKGCTDKGCTNDCTGEDRR